MPSDRTLRVLALCSVGTLVLLATVLVDPVAANFITYVDDSGESLPDDYVLDDERRATKKVRPQDYNDALDRLIANALNTSEPVRNSTVAPDDVAYSSLAPSIACIGTRKVSRARQGVVVTETKKRPIGRGLLSRPRDEQRMNLKDDLELVPTRLRRLRLLVV